MQGMSKSGWQKKNKTGHARPATDHIPAQSLGGLLTTQMLKILTSKRCKSTSTVVLVHYLGGFSHFLTGSFIRNRKEVGCTLFVHA